MTSANPFLGQQEPLYGRSARLAQRTSALRAAKVRGRPVAEVISELVDQEQRRGVVVDIGCGRASTTAHLAHAWNPRSLTGLDRSPALLADARRRLPPGSGVSWVCADFHALPLAESSVDVVGAAFCLYHTRRPEAVVGEFARCLRPGGQAVLVTKSADSYRELDTLVATADLDPHATGRRSLYETFHSGNAEHTVAAHLKVSTVVHHEHVFNFRSVDHVADYLITTPKYTLTGDRTELTTALRTVLDDTGVTTTSTVTYVVARRS